MHALSPGGGAEIGGDIISGDVLVEINGQDVSKLLMGEMADHCIGFPGDQVGYHRVFHTEFAIFGMMWSLELVIRLALRRPSS